MLGVTEGVPDLLGVIVTLGVPDLVGLTLVVGVTLGVPVIDTEDP